MRSLLGGVAGAALLGVFAGVASLAITAEGRAGLLAGVGTATAGVAQLAVDAGIARKRPPQPGDSWAGCDDARAAGSAPIGRDEPGYSPKMDGDGDGIACEPLP